MTTLKLKTLKCNITEDSFGADDPYLIVNGKRAWGPIKANAGDTLILNEQVQFKGKSIVELWEQDLDPDDHLGTHVVSDDEVGNGNTSASFKEKGADYELVYEVVD